MKKSILLLIKQAVMFCLFVSTVYAAMASSSYQIPTMVISGGGGTMSSTSYHTFSTLAQPSPLGSTSSASYDIDAGFWYTMLVDSIGDVNGDGAVNLEDVIAALQVVTGQLPDTLIQEADSDGDGRIGLSEALHILRKLGGRQ